MACTRPPVPGEAGGGDGDRAFPAAHVQHVRARPDPGLVHQPGAHVLEELGAALVVPGGGLGEPGDDLILDGPRQAFAVRSSGGHLPGQPGDVHRFAEGVFVSCIRSPTRPSATALTDSGKVPVAMIAAVCLLIVV